MVLLSELNPPVVNPVGPMLRKLAETEKLGGFPKNMDPTLVAFANHLSEQFNNFFKIHMGNDPKYNAEELFGIESAKCIAHGMKDLTTREHIRKMIGGESMTGQVNMLFECVKTFRSGDTYQEYIRKAREAHDDLIRRMDAINENIANKKTQKLKEQQDRAREKEVAAEIKAQRLRDDAIRLAGFRAQRQAEALEQSENPN
ncbi:hypothetical protein PCASD_25307 [Puccinia coronata f. sp. avenae]|uniref:Uncharacterized protein n=1 Tax=Puccinia coronata f. sp. avenae TaxID=200324 RepID=A0A2N5TK42_9BASI|nr:hypothetical protein PCASD_25307 [Puccinia coronata f. sp. avenae]